MNNMNDINKSDEVKKTVYRIYTFEDLVKTLQAEPKWYEEIKKLLLTEEVYTEIFTEEPPVFSEQNLKNNKQI